MDSLIAELQNNLQYWESFIAGDNTGKLIKSRMIKKITEQLHMALIQSGSYAV